MTAPRQPHFFTSLNGKLTLAIVLPLLALALSSTFAGHYIGRVDGQAMDQLRVSHEKSLELSRATRSVRAEVADYAGQLEGFLDAHERSLFGNQAGTSAQSLADLRAQASTLSTTLIRELEPVKQSFSASIRATSTERTAIELFDKRYIYIVRTTRNLPRLVDIFDESHRRTIDLLEAGAFDQARAQYVFEEHERERALESTLERLTEVLDDLAISVENHIAKTATDVAARADDATSDAMALSVSAASIAIAFVALAAIAFIRLAVSHPISGLTSTMLALAKGNLEIEIENKDRRDEIGKMARALQIVKDHAVERRKIEKDLAEHRGRLEELVNSRTKQIERQKLEIQRSLDEAQSANKMKSEFLASVSHEIRTPMNGIIGTTELLLESNLDDWQKAQASTVSSSAEALLHLINDILDFSKIESGKFELEVSRLDLLSLVEDVAAFLAPKARDKRLDLLVRCAPGTPRFVIGDRARLRQVLINLVSNAIKFTETGYVQLSVEAAASKPDINANVVKFSIKDTGIGIPKDKQALIFERFTQVDGSMSRRYGGTGLGLSISRELITVMGGRLQVDSEVDKGSTFWFAASLANAPSTSETRTSDTSLLEGLKLLIVDDTEASRSLLAEQIKGGGRSYVAVEDGHQALEAMSRAHAEGKPFDIVILDHMMPEMDGIELARHIRDKPNDADTILIMLSSGESFEAIPSVNDEGIGAFLIKPTRKSELLDTLAWLQHAKVKGQGVDQLRHFARGSAAPEPQIEESLRDLRILLVEDNRVNRELARQILTNLSCEVVTAEDGREAVALATETSFDMILMDCQMPIMDGFEASRQIKGMIADGEITDVPIVALTANAMKGDRERCLDAGMDDYETKPVRKRDLIEILTRWCVTKENLAARQITTSSPPPSVGLPPPTESVTAPVESETAAKESPMFEQACLDDMRNVMGDQFKMIIEYYLDDASNYLQQIKTGWQGSDGEAIVAAAHPLKSSSRELGAIELSDIAKQIEENARLAESDDKKMWSIGPLVGELDVCFSKARHELQTILEKAV